MSSRVGNHYNRYKNVLILIILEVLYELSMRTLSLQDEICLNPYYTGSTLWVDTNILQRIGKDSLNPYYTGSTLWEL